MAEKLNFSLIDRTKQTSSFDWINIDLGTNRIGKIRALIEGGTLTIFSINIFPEFERKGHARKIVDMFKASFDEIIADRVRNTAVEFWIKMGFVYAGKGKYIYDKRGIHNDETIN